MNFISKKRGLIITAASLALLTIILSACDSMVGGPNNPLNFENNVYYQGYDGVLMSFVQGMPPDTIYFYGSSYDNSLHVSVEMANVGSAWSRGGIFLSGYDPTMFQFTGITPSRSGGNACWIDIGNIGFGEFGGTLRCDDFYVGAGSSGTIELGARDLFGTSGPYAGTFDLARLFGDVDLYYRSSGGQSMTSIGFDNPGIDVEYANHGRLLLTLFEAIDFSRHYGQEYLLEPDTYEFPGGGLDYINFDGNIVTWPSGLDQTTYSNFMITNCYLYATYAAPLVCVDPSPFTSDAKVCTPSPYTGTKGQGAPVAVTLIEQENSPKQILFTIHIQNVGRGEVYDPGRLEKCSPYYPEMTTTEDKNIVYIGDIRVSGDLQRLQCTPNNFIRLDPRTGEGTIICSYQIPYATLKSAYQAPLVVELWYGYSQAMLKRVMIKRAI